MWDLLCDWLSRQYVIATQDWESIAKTISALILCGIFAMKTWRTTAAIVKHRLEVSRLKARDRDVKKQNEWMAILEQRMKDRGLVIKIDQPTPMPQTRPPILCPGSGCPGRHDCNGTCSVCGKQWAARPAVAPKVEPEPMLHCAACNAIGTAAQLEHHSQGFLGLKMCSCNVFEPVKTKPEPVFRCKQCGTTGTAEQLEIHHTSHYNGKKCPCRKWDSLTEPTESKQWVRCKKCHYIGIPSRMPGHKVLVNGKVLDTICDCNQWEHF